jgi:hypothetical protein
MTIDEKEQSYSRRVCHNKGSNQERRITKVTNSEYEALKAAIKVLFDHLTYEEQEQIIEIVKKKRTEE